MPELGIETDWDYTLVAHNHARASQNPIHDDPVATAYGFKGGLVPGVDVFAYLAHSPALVWGSDWLRNGRMRATFHSPVYDGTKVQIRGTTVGTDAAELELTDPSGHICATATVSLEHGDPSPVDISGWPAGDPQTRGTSASAESLAVRTALGPVSAGFHADRAGEYLAEVGESLPLFTDAAIAHPGWLLRFANLVLVDHVRLGPWIHVSSDTRFIGLVHDGERVETRAVVTEEYERKGHRFVVLDVLITADARAVQRVTHTAIHTLRPAATTPDQIS